MDLTNADERFRRRFWTKVDRRGPDECWPWLAYCKPQGYGQFMLRNAQHTTSSRVALALSIGRPLRPDEFACHTCDNPPCCNPAHLFAGSPADNSQDCVNKGRAYSPKGEGTGSHKLTEAQVREIRSHPYTYGLYARLARQYGVADRTMSAVYKGVWWSHVECEPVEVGQDAWQHKP